MTEFLGRSVTDRLCRRAPQAESANCLPGVTTWKQKRKNRVCLRSRRSFLLLNKGGTFPCSGLTSHELNVRLRWVTERSCLRTRQWELGSESEGESGAYPVRRFTGTRQRERKPSTKQQTLLLSAIVSFEI
jgi:hypothetical protein